jgi:alpha-galactosidase
MLAAPLIAGNDLRTMTREVRDVLTNRAVIAVNQDSLGVQALRHSVKDSIETWVKPLQQGDWAICFLNRSTRARTLFWNWQTGGAVRDTVSKRNLDANKEIFVLRDLWTGKERGSTKTPLNATVGGHDVLMLRLQKR